VVECLLSNHEVLSSNSSMVKNNILIFKSDATNNSVSEAFLDTI
jgi:hypothetical protein